MIRTRSEHGGTDVAGEAIVCDRCDAPARVQVLTGYRDGRPQRRHFCIDCANHPDGMDVAAGNGRSRTGQGTLLVAVGALMLGGGLLFDWVGFHGCAGFGMMQTAGVVVGGVLILAGALLAVDLLAVGGMLLGAIAVLADFWGPLGNPGVGWKQHAVIVIGLLLVAVGLPRLLRRRRAACAELSGKEAVARRP